MRSPASKRAAQEALTAYIRCDCNAAAAAKDLDIPVSTLKSRVKRAIAAGLDGGDEGKIKAPVLPDKRMPRAQLIQHMSDRFRARWEHESAKKWMAFKVDTDLPIGLVPVGDPHVDDNGCNWPLLLEDAEIMKSTPGVHALNIGDSLNNWIGRLASLYANQDSSKDTAWELVEWLFKESGIPWFLMLTGNHDEWGDGGKILRLIAKHICPMVDWRAQFKLVFSNGRECLIDAAHDHKGHSMWNPMHGQQKASVMGGRAHIYIAGHRHSFGQSQFQCPETGRVYELVRVRGYKYIDDYAHREGYGCQTVGASVMIVIDPQASEENMVMTFKDLRQGAEYLTWLRAKRMSQRPKKARITARRMKKKHKGKKR